jgi:hypothetical protein
MAQRIGDFMVSIGAMTPEQVTETMRIQDADEGLRPFGEIAMSLGFIDEAAVKRYLEQRAANP